MTTEPDLKLDFADLLSDHSSWSGVDQAPMDRYKIWRCDGCDLLATRYGDHYLPTVNGHRPRIQQLRGRSWRMVCAGCDLQAYSPTWSALIPLAEAHLLDIIPIPPMCDLDPAGYERILQAVRAL